MPALTAGDTFYICPEGSKVNHLWIIVAVYDADFAYEALAVSVSVTSVEPGRKVDEACLLDVGAHDFLTHKSFIDYQRAMEQEAKYFESLPSGCRRAPISAALLDRIRQGAETSRFIRKGIRAAIRLGRP